MRLLKLTIIILTTFVLISFIKSDESFNIIKELPFADGEDINIYHWASLAILLITCWGFYRLSRKNDEDE
jgi:hypothetical protein